MSEVVIVKRRRPGCLPVLLLLFLGLVILLITVRTMGLILPMYMPTGEMSPAVSTGDHVMMERFSFRSQPPQRGDVVVFRVDNPGPSQEAGNYILRIVGLPGETLQLTEDALLVNDKPIVLHNVLGKIHYLPMQEALFLGPGHETVTVPKDSYFMLGDNTNASKDSRYWGFVPAANVLGKVYFCYWPSSRAGLVK